MTDQYLHARAAIQDLLSNLGRCLDERDFEGLRLLFTSDAEVQTPGGVARGHDALVEQARGRHTTPQGIQHVVTNLLVDMEPDWAGGAAAGGNGGVVGGGEAAPEAPHRARVRGNLLVAFADAGPADPAPFLLGEVYRLAVVRTDDGWRIERMTSSPVWTLNRPPALVLSR